jgi:hypothetical protein
MCGSRSATYPLGSTNPGAPLGADEGVEEDCAGVLDCGVGVVVEPDALGEDDEEQPQITVAVAAATTNRLIRMWNPPWRPP